MRSASSLSLTLARRAFSSSDAATVAIRCADRSTVEIAFGDDERQCNGHLGLFQPARRPWRITICSDLDFVPVHELAHAWIEANTDEHTRATYVEHRNKPSWNSPQHDWNERGVEDAAFIIQQNLSTRARDTLTDEWKRRASAYKMLVGTTSPILDTTTSTETDPHSRHPSSPSSNEDTD